MFWSSNKEASGKSGGVEKIILKDNEGAVIDKTEDLVECFANFFVEKANRLSLRTRQSASTQNPPQPGGSLFIITEKMVDNAIKQLKPKKSYGIDRIPLCIVKDTYKFMKKHYIRLMRLATEKMPTVWKKARVIPLFKKGDRFQPDNYRPISNLCSMDKLFEKIVLNEINRRHGGLEGNHQHGFRSGHSTSTALLDIQKGIAEELENNRMCILYSIDLSAAFDLLRKETFLDTISGLIDDDLLHIIMDFLTDRTFVVEIDDMQSKEKCINLGCAQGSVLGPKLFNLYMKEVTKNMENAYVTSYADDTYVIVPGSDVNVIKCETEHLLNKHLDYLERMGMVANPTKTEAVLFGSEEKLELNIGEGTISTSEDMKVLGVYFDSKLNWSRHVTHVINKSHRLNSALKFIRKKLNMEQFLKVLTCQYYSTCFYGCGAWLHGDTSYADIRKLNALHYRSLRIATQDYRKLMSRASLDLLGRSRPTTWSKYITGNLAIKIARSGIPERLHQSLRCNSYTERRRPGRLKWYDGSRKKIGRQSLRNRCGNIINDLDLDWPNDSVSEDKIRVSLKRHLKMTNDQ